jgi:hypothetical protein
MYTSERVKHSPCVWQPALLADAGVRKFLFTSSIFPFSVVFCLITLYHDILHGSFYTAILHQSKNELQTSKFSVVQKSNSCPLAG